MHELPATRRYPPDAGHEEQMVAVTQSKHGSVQLKHVPVCANIPEGQLAKQLPPY